MDSVYLPREILFRILLFVSADVLHEVVRYVCKQWYDIVTDPLFLTTHLQLSSAGGFLLQAYKEWHQFYYIEGDSSELKKTEIHLPFPAELWGSLNGLVLLHDWEDPDIFHVFNPVTKVKISLPPSERYGLRRSSGFAVDSRGHYKVVHASDGYMGIQMWVFTIGVDKAWRLIDLQSIPLVWRREALLWRRPCAIAGYIYWHATHIDECLCLALDVDTETIYQVDMPEDSIRDPGLTMLISMGTCPGLLKRGGGGEIYRLWKLIDVKSGEWAELVRINLLLVLTNAEVLWQSQIGVCFPVRFTDGDIWFYHGGFENKCHLVRYNLSNGSFVFFPSKANFSHFFPLPHVHTLLSPKNC